jgi:hypothetical protein
VLFLVAVTNQAAVRRNADNDCMIWNITDNYRACANQRTFAYRNAGQYGGVATD